MSKIFLSYRRDDSAAYAGRLYDRLAGRFGKEQIFMDVDRIEPGEDFADVIEKSIGTASVLLVLIGPRWANAADQSGSRRLDNPDDFVRLELSAALSKKMRVIPVLVGGASIPLASDLPDPLRAITRRHAFDIMDTRFHADVDRLIQVLDRALAPSTVAATVAQSPRTTSVPSPEGLRTGVETGGTAVPSSGGREEAQRGQDKGELERYQRGGSRTDVTEHSKEVRSQRELGQEPVQTFQHPLKFVTTRRTAKIMIAAVAIGGITVGVISFKGTRSDGGLAPGASSPSVTAGPVSVAGLQTVNPEAPRMNSAFPSATTVAPEASQNQQPTELSSSPSGRKPQPVTTPAEKKVESRRAEVAAKSAPGISTREISGEATVPQIDRPVAPTAPASASRASSSDARARFSTPDISENVKKEEKSVAPPPAPTQAPTPFPAPSLTRRWEPVKPVEFVIPAGTGGGADQMARLLQGIVLRNNLMKQSLDPVNKSGGAGAEGFLDVKGAKGEAHKIIITLSNLFTTPLATGVPFSWKDLTPVAMLALDQFVLWVNAETPYQNVKDYIEAAKTAGPGKFKMAGTGSKQEDQIITVALEKATGTKFTYVPFKGGGDVATQLAGKHVDSTVNNPIEAVAQWRVGKLRPLCVLDDTRMPYKSKVTDRMSWNDIPTCKEAGVPIDYVMLRGIFMPAGVPQEAVNYYVEVFSKVRQTPEWKEFMERGAFNQTFMAGKEYADWVARAEKEHVELMKEAGFVARK